MNQQKQETVTKQKNPLKIEQGKKLVEYNRRKKKELKRLNEQITKQDDIEHKPKPDTFNNYVYVGGLSVFGLAIGGYLLKLVAIIAISDFTKDYLIKQKIIPNNI